MPQRETFYSVFRQTKALLVSLKNLPAQTATTTQLSIKRHDRIYSVTRSVIIYYFTGPKWRQSQAGVCVRGDLHLRGSPINTKPSVWGRRGRGGIYHLSIYVGIGDRILPRLNSVVRVFPPKWLHEFKNSLTTYDNGGWAHHPWQQGSQWLLERNCLNNDSFGTRSTTTFK